MAALDEMAVKAQKMYDDIMQKADPRVAAWPMMSAPWSSFILCILYVVLVRMGPWFMKDKKPYELRNILVIYNLAMVGLSTYTFTEFLLSGWLAGYTLGCQTVDFSNSPQALRMANACWWFYISKFVELLDTFFFLLRKKDNQVTFLHVFHHGIMPVSWWFAVKFVPGGFTTFHAMCNSFIHMVMYFYYGLSAMGPAFHKYLWWKKYMTKMQIAQFVIVTIHSFQLCFIDCEFPIYLAYWIGGYAIIFLGLFANFYIQAYRHGKRHPPSVTNKAEQNGHFNESIKSNGKKEN